MDCGNVTDYFRRLGVATMTPRELFDFTVHASLPSVEAEREFIEAALQRAMARASSGAGEHDCPEAEVEAGVFMAAFIPHSLAEVRDVEAETAKYAAGQTAGLYYGALTGLAAGAAAGAPPAAAAGECSVDGAPERPQAATPRAFLVALPPKPRLGEDDASSMVEQATAALGAACSPVAGSSASAELVLAPLARNSSSGTTPLPALRTQTGGASGCEQRVEDGGGESDEGGSSDYSDDDAAGSAEDEAAPKDSGNAAYVRRGQSKEERKAHKTAIKEAKRERRKTKIPKAVKRHHAKSGK